MPDEEHDWNDGKWVWMKGKKDSGQLYEAIKLVEQREKRLGKVRSYESHPPNEKTLAKYGLRQQDYDRLMAEQGGACAICFNDGDALVIDHDHDTGNVRGLLCSQCNSLLGFACDDVRRLRSAIQYLSMRAKP